MTRAETALESVVTHGVGLELEQVGPVTVARTTRESLVDETSVNAVGGYLLSLVMDLSCRRLVLNLGTLRRLSSSMVGKLIALHKKIQKTGGLLLLCQVSAPVSEILQKLHLHELFTVLVTEDDALKAFQKNPTRSA
jgi:anti-anti-sigma factor